MFFLGSLSIQCKIRCNRPSDTWRSTCWPPLVHVLFRILNILPQVLYSQPLLKDSLSL